MCEFKSGIIFKNRVELAPLENESHSSLLEKLDIEDNEFNASKKFVRAELIPQRNMLSLLIFQSGLIKSIRILYQNGIVTIQRDMKMNLENPLKIL